MIKLYVMHGYTLFLYCNNNCANLPYIYMPYLKLCHKNGIFSSLGSTCTKATKFCLLPSALQSPLSLLATYRSYYKAAMCFWCYYFVTPK